MWYFRVYYNSYNVSQLRKRQFNKILNHNSYVISIKLEDYELDRLFIYTGDRHDIYARPQTSPNSIAFLVDPTVVQHPPPSLLTTPPKNITFFDLLDFYQTLLMVQVA